MRAISLWQPWASGIARGYKKVETRHWATSYRGRIAIHAAKRWRKDQREAVARLAKFHTVPAAYFNKDPRGALVAVATLVDCVEMTSDLIAEQSALELQWGGWEPGRYAWVLEDIHCLKEAIPMKGRQGMWRLTHKDEKAVLVAAGLRAA